MRAPTRARWCWSRNRRAPPGESWRMRVALVDPPAYTPPYDRALAAALARAGADVELATSHFRFGPVAKPEGYRASETFYPFSSRLPAGRARLALKALEHPLVLGRLALARPDVLHL